MDFKEAFREIMHKLRAEAPMGGIQRVSREEGVVGKWGRKYRLEAYDKVRERSQHGGLWDLGQLRLAGVCLLKSMRLGSYAANCDGSCRPCQRV